MFESWRARREYQLLIFSWGHLIFHLLWRLFILFFIASFIFHEAQDVDNEDVTIVILEHEESHKVVAINTEDDKVTLEVRDWNHFSQLEI